METEVIINEWDNVIIQINNENTSIGNIRMKKEDIKCLMDLHKATRGEVLELMLEMIENTPNASNKN